MGANDKRFKLFNSLKVYILRINMETEISIRRSTLIDSASISNIEFAWNRVYRMIPE